MKHLVLIFSNPKDGEEAEFNRWYEDIHLDEILATTGWEGAQRFKLMDQRWAESAHNYLALYEIEADNPDDIISKLEETRSKRQQSSSFNKETAAIWVFSQIGPRHKKTT